MNKQQLANKIWESANKMRSKIEANEYKDYILGFIFYKFLSEKEEKFMIEQDLMYDEMAEYLCEDDLQTVDFVKKSIGYFISYDHLFSTWINKGKDFDISDVRDALSAFNRQINKRYKKLFEDIFDTLETGLSKLGTTAQQQTKAVRDLIQLINDIPMDGSQDYDVLGFVYEFLIQKFAANAGKKAGEFYTPHEVSTLMSEIVAWHLKDKNKISIFDSCSGSGSLLINIGRSVSRYMTSKDNIKYYAQELKRNTYNLTRMNLIMRGLLPANIYTRNADTLEDDWPYFDESDPNSTYEMLPVDAVVSNPPYSLSWDPEGKENDPRYSYGLAPRGKADYAFLLHDLYHLNKDGIMCIVLPHGVLFRGGEEGKIRKNLIENNKIDAIIGLPSNIFYGTGIPTIIIVLKQNRSNDDVLIIDASKGFMKDGKENKLRACDIRKIADTVIKRENIEKYSSVVSKDEIRENDYNLNIPRYVDSSEAPESYDIFASMFGGIPNSELALLNKYWKTFDGLQQELFIEKGTEHVELKSDNIKEVIKNNKAVNEFIQKYQDRFADFGSEIFSLMKNNVEISNLVKMEDNITNEIFTRFEDIPLLNKYEAYQLFYNHWQNISNDLETISLEGEKCIVKVVPNMVTKKKKGKDAEVQEGWKGLIIPFDLVQKTLLKEERDNIDALNNQLSDTEAKLEEYKESLREELEEEDDSQDIVDDAKIKKYKKEIRDLKREIKNADEVLQENTMMRFGSFTDEEVSMLLNLKWVEPIMSGLMTLPLNLVDGLVEKIESLKEKYSETFEDIENQISRTEDELIGFIDQLTGSDADMAGLQEFKKILGGGE